MSSRETHRTSIKFWRAVRVSERVGGRSVRRELSRGLITEYGKPFTANGFGNKFKDWCRQADLHWPAPVLAIDAAPDRGPVLVTIEYRIDPEKSDAFLRAIRDLSQQRKRDGAYAWDVFEDAAEKAGRGRPEVMGNESNRRF